MEYVNYYKQMRLLLIYDLPMIEDEDRRAIKGGRFGKADPHFSTFGLVIFLPTGMYIINA